jgi:DNA-binding NtrC family response regulator
LFTSYWNLSRQRLAETEFRVVNSSNRFETTELSSSGQVDAFVWDLDHNHAEVTLITNEIKRLRPEFPTIVLTEGAAPDTLRALADTLIPKGSDEVLVGSLEKILSA